MATRDADTVSSHMPKTNSGSAPSSGHARPWSEASSTTNPRMTTTYTSDPDRAECRQAHPPCDPRSPSSSSAARMGGGPPRPCVAVTPAASTGRSTSTVVPDGSAADTRTVPRSAATGRGCSRACRSSSTRRHGADATTVVGDRDPAGGRPHAPARRTRGSRSRASRCSPAPREPRSTRSSRPRPRTARSAPRHPPRPRGESVPSRRRTRRPRRGRCR